MQSLTIDQLRAAHLAGGVSGVTLKGDGGEFVVHVSTLSGSQAVLAKARSTEPRRFGNPLAAMKLLLGIGITSGQFDANNYDPEQKAADAGNRGRAAAMRQAHEAAAYTKWLAGEIQESIDDPRPNRPHEDILAELDAEIAMQADPGRRGRAS